MLWSELREIEDEGALWEIPGKRTKNKQTHLVPLSSQVRKLVQSLPYVGALVFTTTGETPVSGFGKAKTRLISASRKCGDLTVLSQCHCGRCTISDGPWSR